MIFTSSHIVILVIETYTELSPPQEDTDIFSLIPVVVFLHSVLAVVEMTIMRIRVLYATAFYG